MSTLYGADVAQLRALAAQLERVAGQLDGTRSAVAHAVQASPWRGPSADQFRAHWAGQYSASLISTSRRLREAARQARANADGQEQASVASGGITASSIAMSIGAGVSGGPSFLDRISKVWDGAHFVSDVYGTWTMPAGIATAVAGLTFLARNVRQATSLKSLTTALQFSSAYKTLDSASSIIGLGKTAGKVFGAAGVIFDSVDMVTKAAHGDVGGAVMSGVHACLGVASLVPGPVGLAATAVNVGITLYEHRKEIADFANTTAKVAGRAASDLAKAASDAGRAAGQAAKGFVDGVAKAAKSLWPF